MAAPTQKFKGVRATLPTGRASFPNIFVPREKYFPPGAVKPTPVPMEYSIDILFDKATDLTKFKAQCDEALAEVYGKDKAKWPKAISYPLIDQANLIEKAQEKGTDTSHLEEGAMYARFKTNAKGGAPKIVDQKMEDILDPTQIYGGCFVRVSCQLKVNPIKGKDPVTKKETLTVYVTPYLQGVQFMKDGDPIGSGRAAVSDMFEPVENDLVG